MKKFKNIVIVSGTYKTREGQEKKRYQTIGSVFLDDNENLKIKIDAVPMLEGGWNGWANCYDLEDASKPRKGGFDETDKDIPF